MSGKFRYVFLAMLGLVVTLYAARVEHTTYTAYLSVDSSGDTSQVVKITPSAGIDSFAYIDSFSYQSDTTAHKTITWTSPPQQMRLDVGLDTSITYTCTLDCGTNKYGFAYDATGETDLLDSIIEHLVDSINNVAGMKDTIAAHDSATYIKVISKIAQIDLEGDARWTMAVGDSLDTTTIWTTSVADVCDSMTASLNASANLDSFVTAYDSTTFYIVQSDDAGVLFFVAIKDTSQDTTTSQTNVTSYSTYQDTFKVVRMVWDDFEIAGIDFWAILDSSVTTTNQGLGLSDSGYVWIYAVRNVHGNEQLTLIDSAVRNALPCSLHILITADTTGGGVDPDSMWYEYWSLAYRIADTASDTVMNPSYTIYVDYKLIGK